VSAIGEFDELQEALADLKSHYRRAHPELVNIGDSPEEVPHAA